MRAQNSSRLVSAALLVTLMPWCAGCATEIHLRQSPGVAEGAGGGRLLVRVFENRSDRNHDISTHRKIATELYRLEGKTETLVRTETEPRWSVADLPAGDYVLRVPDWVDDVGGVQARQDGHHDHLVIRANQTTVADVVLSDPKKAWVGALIATGLVVAWGYWEIRNWEWYPLAGLEFN